VCGTEARPPYNETVGFDVYQTIVCQECGAKINMPVGLAVT
jgi:DNA-directed RNA polymerase subunit RPC12/RpoP